MNLLWKFPGLALDPAANRLASELALPPFLAALLCRRGFSCVETVEAFLQPRLKSLSDPFLLPGMEAGVERIHAAIDRRERIVLYGDYDVDGVTSMALLARLLKEYGLPPATFLPGRMDEGYGLSPDGVARCLREHSPELLIALDCGTSSATEVADLRRAGIDVLIFDHHEARAALPDATVLVNPKLGPGFHYLCTAGIVFKLCHALLKRRPLPGFDLRDYLDLAALGTVADLVPLVEENRILVQKGLPQIANTRWPGLRALMDVAGVQPPISPSQVGFQLGPRLNAAGRLHTAEAALELLLTDDSSRARTLAIGLDQQNRERQAVERKITQEAEARVAETFDPTRDAAIVVGDPAWHAGVVGIVASRLSRQHHRPTIVIAFDEAGMGKGSGRSIPGFSLVQGLGECAPLLEKFGGHEMAAGLTVRQENFEAFRTAFLAGTRAALSDEALQPVLELDGELSLDDLSMAFLERHELLQPFGMGNMQPLWCARAVRPAGEPRILKEKHLLIELHQGGRHQRAIYFGGAAGDLPRPPWDVAFRVERNEFRETVSLQMQVQAIRSAE